LRCGGSLQLFACCLSCCFAASVSGNQAPHRALWPANNNNRTAQKLSGFLQIIPFTLFHPRPATPIEHLSVNLGRVSRLALTTGLPKHGADFFK
jgi:hypothetical protein